MTIAKQQAAATKIHLVSWYGMGRAQSHTGIVRWPGFDQALNAEFNGRPIKVGSHPRLCRSKAIQLLSNRYLLKIDGRHAGVSDISVAKSKDSYRKSI
jgi:hypothetical protein